MFARENKFRENLKTFRHCQKVKYFFFANIFAKTEINFGKISKATNIFFVPTLQCILSGSLPTFLCTRTQKNKSTGGGGMEVGGAVIALRGTMVGKD